MNRSRITGNLTSHGILYSDIANDRVGIGSTIPGNKLSLPDSAKIGLGNAEDLTLYHDSGHSYINNALGDLVLKTTNDDIVLESYDDISMYVQGASGSGAEKAIMAIGNGAVELYHNNSKKLETTSSGVTVTGGVTADGFTLGDNENIQFGASNDLKIFHNGNHSYISDLGTGDLRITGSAVHIQNAAQSENMIKCFEGAQVELYHSNSKKFQTTSAGATLSGHLQLDGHLDMNDGHYIKLGTGDDLQLYHDSSNSIIDNNTGDLIIRGDGDDVKILAEDDIVLRDNDDSTNFIHCINGGAVELYHNGSKKLETTSSGVTVTGTATATGGFSGSGASLTNVNATTLDSLDSTQFLRSDANDTMTGVLTINTSSAYGLTLNGSNDGKIVLNGTNPYIRFQEGGTNKAYIQWNSNGYLTLLNQASGEYVKVGSGANGLTYVEGGAEKTVFHSGNLSTFGANQITLTTSTNYPLKINSSADGKIVLEGSNNPYIRFREGTTDKAYIQWVTDGILQFVNQESGEYLRIGSGTNGLTFTEGGNSRIVYHAGNLSPMVTDGSNTVDGNIILAAGHYFRRSDHHSGHLEGSYNNVGGNSAKSNPIYTIGSSYNPTDAALSNMYGIGYSKGTAASFLNSLPGQANSWGMYVAGDGDARVFLDGQNGNINAAGHLYCDRVYTDLQTTRYLTDVSGNYGSIQINGGGSGNWQGFSIQGRAVFMHDGGTATGIYNDVDNHWLFYAVHGGESYMRCNNTNRVTATSSGATIGGALTVNGTCDLNGNINVGTGNASYITMEDSDNGSRQIHCNSNYIGFLNSSGSWAARCSDAGQWDCRSGLNVEGNTYTQHIQLDAGYRLRRSDHHTGHLEGSYNNVAANSAKSNPIYTIGSNYNPTDAALSNMYGIGYSHGDASFTPTGASWGMYVAADGDARIFLDASNSRVYIGTAGNRYISQATGNYGTFQCNATGVGNYQGWSIDGRVVFMHDGGNVVGIYNDVDNEWLFRCDRNGANIMYHNNTPRVTTDASGAVIGGRITCTGTSTINNLSFSLNSQHTQQGRFTTSTSNQTASNASALAGTPGTLSYAYGYQEASSTSGGTWANPFPNMVFGYHTGVQIGGHYNYGGTRFYNDHPSRTSTKLFSVGEGDNNVRSYGNLFPSSNNSMDLGSSSLRWRVVYTNDLELSNKGSQNNVDGTWGDWTLQEGEDNIYMINNRSGKKFKINMTEVS